MKRAPLKVLALALAIALPVETMSYLAGKMLARQSLLYEPQPLASHEYAAYLKDRHPVLGWPGRNAGRYEFDDAGSRLVPSFPDPAMPSCAAVYGDSYTWGYSVSPEQTYANVLSTLMRCRVANYGIGGYGTDQAFLRYQDTAHDRPPIVILGHYSDNIVRNVNQERGFLTNQVLALKPRFVLADGELTLVPLPELTEAEYRSLGARGRQLLPNDYFAPGGPAGIRSFEFPYTLSVAGIVRHYRLRAGLEGRPSYAEFYDPLHPSQALQVTEALMHAFVEAARRRGQKAMILLIPDEKDLRWLRAHGALPYAELATRLRASGIAVPAVAEALSRDLGGRDPCSLYTRCGDGHFAPGAHRQLAEIAYGALASLGWLKSAYEPGL
jgi:hypothetical protein